MSIARHHNAWQVCECNFGHGRVASALHRGHALEHAGWHGAAVPLIDFFFQCFVLLHVKRGFRQQDPNGFGQTLAACFEHFFDGFAWQIATHEAHIHRSDRFKQGLVQRPVPAFNVKPSSF